MRDWYYDVRIENNTGGRSLNQNALKWWANQKQAEIMNQGHVGPEAVKPKDLYAENIMQHSDLIIVDLVPEAVDHLNSIIRVVFPLASHVLNGKKWSSVSAGQGAVTGQKNKCNGSWSIGSEFCTSSAGTKISNKSTGGYMTERHLYALKRLTKYQTIVLAAIWYSTRQGQDMRIFLTKELVWDMAGTRRVRVNKELRALEIMGLIKVKAYTRVAPLVIDIIP
ncbi:MAG: helix-turn-helix domain-containing protein [Spirochaetales bacterium]